ncbi:alpha/beta hydrolase [Marinobacter sp.]|jgi:pimeloyl-ACP methyl ester carboxylesterase|uniref:alpha/beta fold hydrolase n=1 Tax=Marinobacter sp. TaxID=50741 RepID=UPI0019900C71|nr:alpha/beta fold hydrolase [Marinobacter sp.]
MTDLSVKAPGNDMKSAATERTWPLRAITLAGQYWPAPAGVTGKQTPTLLLHGWLDNSETFSLLAPKLGRLGDLYALDMAGHGHSGHRPEGQAYLLVDYVADLAELLESHFLTDSQPQVDLVGHSLGGIVSLLYAATFPEHVRRLVMIDSLGPLTRPPAAFVDQLRKAIRKRIAGSGRGVVYPDIATAARSRAGGLSPLSDRAAMKLVRRNMQAVEGGYRWRTDPRLRHPSPMMMDEAQVEACMKAVPTPALFIRASEGLLAESLSFGHRLEFFRQLQVVDVPGGHHCHLDGDVEPVAAAILEFLGND